MREKFAAKIQSQSEEVRNQQQVQRVGYNTDCAVCGTKEEYVGSG